MSSKSTAWAIEQQGLTPTAKLVLIIMADSASLTGVTFSSNKTIALLAGFLKEDTVAESQKKLVELNLIADTGKRVGATGRVKVFQLPAPACSKAPCLEDLMCFGNPPRNGSLNSDAIPPQSPANNPPITRLAGSPLKKEQGIKEKEKTSRLFQKPSIEEVVQFCISVGLPKSDGEAFFWGKEGNGWKNGGNPVKDWKATIRQWKAAGYHPSQKHGGQSRVRPPVNICQPWGSPL